MNLEQYLRDEYAAGKIDFTFRVSVWKDDVYIYIHPQGKDGGTTPNLSVKGNALSLHPNSIAPDWIE